MPGTNTEYTGTIINLKKERHLYRERHLIKGKMKVKGYWRKLYFEAYENPEDPFEKRDEVIFNLDMNGKPINLRKLDIYNIN